MDLLGTGYESEYVCLFYYEMYPPVPFSKKIHEFKVVLGSSLVC